MKNVRVVTFVTSQSLQTGAIIVARLAALKAVERYGYHASGTGLFQCIPFKTT